MENGRHAVEKLIGEGLQNVETIEIDISKKASIEVAKNKIQNRVNRLDILINNAGIRVDYPQFPPTANIEVIRLIYETNLFGTIQVIQSFLDLLKNSVAPRIVNVTSGLTSLALHNDPMWKNYSFKGAAFDPSKTALHAYTMALAYELRDTHFKINAVDPDYTATEIDQYRGKKHGSEAASLIIKYAILDESGPSGKYCSDDNNPVIQESPW